MINEIVLSITELNEKGIQASIKSTGRGFCDTVTPQY
jgi:hypothetical protein